MYRWLAPVLLAPHTEEDSVDTAALRGYESPHGNALGGGYCLERVLQVGDQVVGVFDAY